MTYFRPNLKLARIGISLFFFTNGAIFAGILPRFPEVKELLNLSNSEFGMMVIANSIGAMCSFSLPSRILRRFGARAASLWGTVLLVTAIGMTGLAAYSGNPLLFASLIFASGLTDSVVDNAQNTHAMRVQRAYGKSIISSFHALWSAGAVAGGLVSTWLASIGVPLYTHMPIASGVLLLVAVFAVKLSEIPADAYAGNSTKTPNEASESQGNTANSASFLSLLPLALIGIAGIQIEIVGNDWSANYMVEAVGWKVSDAGVAYAVLVVAQFVGRFLGDVMVNAWGRARVARFGLLMASAAFLVAALFPTAAIALPAFAVAGFGSATLVPSVFAAAHSARGYQEGAALTFVSWIMRAGNLLTSPFIGFVADASSLRWAILVPLILAIIVQVYLKRLNYDHESQSDVVAQTISKEND